ncbi:MAG: transglutaminase family protein [Chitinophagaceae bacterium]|nr:transglutaminase family protein [Chitinophagaceae bacterium]
MSVFTIHHITKYEYDRPVKESVNEIKVFPYPSSDQEILMQELIITDQPDIFVFDDYWGNKTGSFNLLSPHKELVIESKLKVRTASLLEPDFSIPSYTSELPGLIGTDLHLLQLVRTSAPKSINKMREYVSSFYDAGKPIAEIVKDCCAFIFSDFTYIKGITNIETTVDEIVAQKAGVCQDFAHVMLELLRMIGIPSRYVSGYICPNKNGMRGEGATHAWVEAFIPHYGWIGIDPTNNVWAKNNHVKLAVGRDFSDCTPAKGTFKGPAKQSLSVYVSVGYEDGHVFEEITDVRLQKQAGADDAELIIDNFAGQQQQ